MFSGCLTLTAMDASGRWCRAALELPDPHFRLTRCLSSDLSVAREHPAEAPSLAAGVTSGEPDRPGPITVLSVLVGGRPPSQLGRGRDEKQESISGGQYLSATYIGQLAAYGIRSSVGRPGPCFDNAAAESFFATLKSALLHRAVWPTRQHAKTAIFHYVEGFYNRLHRHSTLHYRRP